MKLAVINPSRIKGIVNIPCAKAYAHRYILASFLAGADIKLKGNFEGDDVFYTLNAVKELGCNIQLDSKENVKQIKMTNSHNDIVNNAENDILTIGIGESGSSLRFLLPICAALGKHVIIDGCGRLSSRPIDELINALESNGCTFHTRTLPIEISGKLQGGTFEINPEASSQFVTGLLFALPILNEDSKLVLKGKVTSTPYIEMSLNVIKEFGIKINKTDYGYYIYGNQKYTAPKEIEVESDWSSACFIAVLGSIFGDIQLRGLNPNSLQGDKKIIDILKDMGANIKIDNNDFIFTKSNLKAITVDVTNIPDMAPILAVAFVVSEGEGILKGVDRLKIKESDRLKAIQEMLDSVGASYKYLKDDNGTLIIQGNSYSKLKEVHFKGCNDHRIVMCQSVLSLLLDAKAKIEYAQSVNKSFPSFFQTLVELGAEVEVKNE